MKVESSLPSQHSSTPSLNTLKTPSRQVFSDQIEGREEITNLLQTIFHHVIFSFQRIKAKIRNLFRTLLYFFPFFRKTIDWKAMKKEIDDGIGELVAEGEIKGRDKCFRDLSPKAKEKLKHHIAIIKASEDNISITNQADLKALMEQINWERDYFRETSSILEKALQNLDTEIQSYLSY